MLSPSALSALRTARVVEDRVYLEEQLERNIYEEVNEVLVRLRGRWKGGKVSAHVFPYDPTAALEAVAFTGEMPAKNPTAFFPTPPEVIEIVLSEMKNAVLRDGTSILEPSAGDGAIVAALRQWCEMPITAVEIDSLNIAMMRRRNLRNVNIIQGDFLKWKGSVYGHVVMNPPFSVAGDPYAYISHIYHAWEMVHHEGLVVSVIPSVLGKTYVPNQKVAAFADFVRRAGYHVELPDGAFKESGTLVNTQLVVLTKQDIEWHKKEYNGYPSYDLWNLHLFLENDSELHRKYYQLVVDAESWETDMFGIVVDPAGIDKLKQFYVEAAAKYSREIGEHMILTDQELNQVADILSNRIRE